ncbi:unnamed protein product [Pylaiella littoralis]
MMYSSAGSCASNGSNGMLVSRTAWPTRQGQQQQMPGRRRTQTIISTNLKTELCRNFEKGVCTYGERCAFAHGRVELKYRTLREMQNAGRIPDAVKYRCIPCMTWVATGSCPYSTRCVFVHDPRVQGREEAWLYAGSHMSSAYHSSDSAFFFPDLRRDPDSQLPKDSFLYDLDPAMSIAQDRADRAVYSMWYSFVSMLTNLEAVKAGDLPSPAKSKLATQHPAPSPSSSSNSTISPCDRGGSTRSFVPSFSTSPKSSSDGSSSSIGGGEEAGHFPLTAPVSCCRNSVATSSGGADSPVFADRSDACSNSSGDSVAAKEHEAAECRLVYGGCPRLQCFVGLSRGVPARPPTPTSPDFFLEGFPADGAPSVFSFASTTPVTADTRSSSAFFGGVRRGMRLPPPSSSRRYAYGDWGLPPKPTESPTASLPMMNRYPRSSSPTLPRDGAFHKVNVTAAAVCEARESPRMVLPGSDCPRAFTESLGRRHYHHQRHTSPTVRTAARAFPQPDTPRSSEATFAAILSEYEAQLSHLRFSSVPERRGGGGSGAFRASTENGYGLCIS